MSYSTEVENNASLSIEIPTEQAVECIGSVKWFNTKSGYGFMCIQLGVGTAVRELKS